MTTSTSSTRVQGNTMLVILMVVAILSAAVGGALSLTSSISRNVNRTYRYQDALAVGDGALDYLFAHWQMKASVNSNTQLSASAYNDGLPMPTADQFPSVENFKVSAEPDDLERTDDDDVVISNFRIRGLDPSWKLENPVADADVPPASYGMNEGARSYFYLASADVTLRNLRGKPMKVPARRIFEKEIGSPWMYAIFYTSRLEIHPGPEFHVTGWVHTNENLYTAHNSLWFESKVTHVGHYNKNGEYAPGDTNHKGTPVAPHFAPDLPARQVEVKKPMGMDVPDFNNTDSNKNNDGYRELIERPDGVPDTSDPKVAMLEQQRYYNQAGIRILVDAHQADGTPIVKIFEKGATTPLTSGPVYDAVNSAITVGPRSATKIQDNREGKDVQLITLNMGKITDAYQKPQSNGNPPPLAGTPQVIYVSDSTATQTSKVGVRLMNGGTMPAGGLTVASDNPVYIQGDYNTGTKRSADLQTVVQQPESNLTNGNPNKNTVPGYVKQSCAVLGDAVMILSNAWKDANSTAGVNSGNRTATPTTVNTAIVSGIVPTNPAEYSGGAENFPRFMEKWGSGNAFTYHGSMVQLYNSQQNIGEWGRDNVYDPPKRNWFFERQFYTDPPPGTLSLISYKKSRWYQQADPKIVATP